MLYFPEKTIINKRIPKQKFYDNLNISARDKRLFIDEIESVVWFAKITPDTIAVRSSEEIEEIEVIQINLNQKSCSETVLKLVNKAIPYNLVFELCFGAQVQYAICHRRYFYTEWCEEQKEGFSLQGYSLDEIWKNLVLQIGGFSLEADRTLEEQITENERKEKLQKDIEKLERMAKKELQPKKKFELHQEILRLKNE